MRPFHDGLLNPRAAHTAVALAAALAASVAAAQTPRVHVTIEKDEAIAPPGAPSVQWLVTKQDDRARVGNVVRRDRKLAIVFAEGAPVELPRDLETQVSGDGKTIVQFGDETKLDLPRRTDVYWLDAKGAVVGSLVGRYAGNAVVSLSTDGYTAVGGKRLDKPSEVTLGLYSPQGKPVWEVRLAANERVAMAAVMPGGRSVVTVVTDGKRWLEDNRLTIHRERGAADAPVVLGVVQKLVLLGDGQRAFVQGFDAFGVLDVAAKRLAWKRAGKIRMVSPHGAALAPDGRTLFLMLAGPKEKATQAEYRWILRALDAATGDEKGSLELPKPTPATWSHVFEDVTASHVKVLAGSSRVTLAWRQEGGDR